MATTTNYGWTTPDDTALVKDGASAIRTLGSSVDTTTKNLNPETTLGDMSFRSSTSNVNTRIPIGSSGQHLTVVAGVPAWATASDQTPLTTKGDLLGFSTLDARIPIGANGTLLTADSTETLGLKWAAPAPAGKVLQVLQTVKTDTFSMSGQTFTDVTGISQAITPSSASSKILVIIQLTTSSSTDYGAGVRLVRGSTTVYVGDSAGNRYQVSAPVNGISSNGNYNVATSTISYLDSPSTTSSTTYKVQARAGDGGSLFYLNRSSNDANDPTVPRGASSITLMEIGA